MDYLKRRKITIVLEQKRSKSQENRRARRKLACKTPKETSVLNILSRPLPFFEIFKKPAYTNKSKSGKLGSVHQ